MEKLMILNTDGYFECPICGYDKGNLQIETEQIECPNCGKHSAINDWVKNGNNVKKEKDNMTDFELINGLKEIANEILTDRNIPWDNNDARNTLSIVICEGLKKRKLGCGAMLDADCCDDELATFKVGYFHNGKADPIKMKIYRDAHADRLHTIEIIIPGEEESILIGRKFGSVIYPEKERIAMLEDKLNIEHDNFTGLEEPFRAEEPKFMANYLLLDFEENAIREFENKESFVRWIDILLKATHNFHFMEALENIQLEVPNDVSFKNKFSMPMFAYNGILSRYGLKLEEV